jgi:hypothetical protein
MAATRRLPVPVPLMRTETLASYLARLAAANHLDSRDLRAHLGMRTRRKPPDLDRLAAMTGHAPHLLDDVLVDARPPPGRSWPAPLTGRIACRRCTASRGIAAAVYCVDPDQRVCHRHRRWLGGPGEDADQHDLSGLPEVLAAQRRHHRLLRRHGTETARSALYWATKIIDGWTERGERGGHRERRLARLPGSGVFPEPERSVLRMVNYAEVVTLAGLLASESWRAIASADHRRDRLTFDREVARRLNLAPTGFAPDDPLVSWQEAEALARRRRLHQQPGYRGPEVWLSQAGEAGYELVPGTKWPG